MPSSVPSMLVPQLSANLKISAMANQKIDLLLFLE